MAAFVALSRVEDSDFAPSERGFRLKQTCGMPANNLMLLFRLAPWQHLLSAFDPKQTLTLGPA